MWASLIVNHETERGSSAASGVAVAKRRTRWSWWLALIAASVFGIVSLGVIMYLATNKGRIKIEINDPNVVVTIDDGKTFSVEGLGGR